MQTKYPKLHFPLLSSVWDHFVENGDNLPLGQVADLGEVGPGVGNGMDGGGRWGEWGGCGGSGGSGGERVIFGVGICLMDME